MFELFGILPLIKIVLLAFIVIYLMFFLGRQFVGDYSSNNGIHLVIGSIIFCGFIAIPVTYGKTVFTPLVIALYVLLKPNIRNIKDNLRKSLQPSLGFFLVFVLCFIMQLLKEPYFSSDFISTSYTDYSFYISAMQDILISRVESTVSYLFNYGIDVAPNIYHYYDLYLFSPVLFFNIPPLIGYLYFLNSFLFAISIYCLVSYFDIASKKKWFYIILGLVSICLIGYGFSDNSVIYRYSVVYFPKCTVLFAIIMMLKFKDKLSMLDTMVIVLIVSLILNPLLFVVVSISVLAVVLYLLLKKQVGIKDLFQIKYMLILGVFLMYFAYVFLSKSDNSVLYTFEGELSFKEFINGFIFRYKGYLGMFQHFPLLLILGLLMVYRYLKNRNSNLIVVFSFLTLVSGHLVASLMNNHFEGTQFFYITFTPFLAVIFYYSCIELMKLKQKIAKILLGALAFTTLLLYVMGGYKIFLKPRVSVLSSIEFNKELKEARKELDGFKAMQFRVIDTNTDWTRALPYLVYDLGYFQLYENSHIIQPTAVSFFQDEIQYPNNALNLIGNGPFQKHCNEIGIHPHSYYDPLFIEALDSFIKKNQINTLIFNKDVVMPDWIEMLDVKKLISPVKSYDQHFIYLLK